MEAYYKEVRRLEDKFHGLDLNHIAQRYNEAADKLTKIMSGQTTVLPDVFSRDLHKPSVELGTTEGVDGPSLDPPSEAKVPSTGADIMQTEGSPPPVDLEPNWRILYLDCLIRGELPSDKTEARRIARWAKTFMIHGNNEELYRCSPTGILALCHSQRRQKSTHRSTLEGLRSSCGPLNPHRKHILAGLLLANYGL
jgi:hypothetical protein